MTLVQRACETSQLPYTSSSSVSLMPTISISSPTFTIAALYPARHHRATARDRKYVLHRHQKITVNRTLRLRYVAVHLAPPASRIDGTPISESNHPRTPSTHSPSRSACRHQETRTSLRQIPNLHLDQLQQAPHHLPGPPCSCKPRCTEHQPDGPTGYVLPRLRHRTVRRTHHQNRTVHLRRTRDHVLHIVRMTRTVNVRVVTICRSRTPRAPSLS